MPFTKEQHGKWMEEVVIIKDAIRALHRKVGEARVVAECADTDNHLRLRVVERLHGEATTYMMDGEIDQDAADDLVDTIKHLARASSAVRLASRALEDAEQAWHSADDSFTVFAGQAHMMETEG